jgi:hypothetical protein
MSGWRKVSGLAGVVVDAAVIAAVATNALPPSKGCTVVVDIFSPEALIFTGRRELVNFFETFF